MSAPGSGVPATDLLVVSGSSRVRTAAPLNHRIYADRIGVPYVFDLAPSTVERIYLQKIDVIRRHLASAEWIFWIDDDAFFTDFSIDLRHFLDDVGDRELVFCQSPVNPRGGWTWMSAGQFFLRRSEASLALLDTVLATDLDVVRRWWQPETFGLFTNGDQDALVYALMGPDQRWRDAYVRLPWRAFNARPYHYDQRLDEHFICHFAVPGGRPKAEVVAEFAARLGTTPALCDASVLAPFRVYLERSEIGRLVGVEPPGASGRAAARSTDAGASLAPRLRRGARRAVRRLARWVRRSPSGRPG